MAYRSELANQIAAQVSRPGDTPRIAAARRIITRAAPEKRMDVYHQVIEDAEPDELEAIVKVGVELIDDQPVPQPEPPKAPPPQPSSGWQPVDPADDGPYIGDDGRLRAPNGDVVRGDYSHQPWADAAKALTGGV